MGTACASVRVPGGDAEFVEAVVLEEASSRVSAAMRSWNSIVPDALMSRSCLAVQIIDGTLSAHAD